MQLPDDILAIIRDYSKPVTRPDWRTICPLSGHLLYMQLNSLRFEHMNRSDKKVYNQVFKKLIKTQWGEIYFYIRIWGIHDASKHFKTTVDDLYKMPGIIQAQNFHLYGIKYIELI
jgi:hypothetical protein